MAAFQYEKHHPFLLDSCSSSPLFLFPNTSAAANLSPTTNINNTNMSSFLQQPFQNNYIPCFSPLPHHHPFYDQPHPTLELSSSINNITTAKGTTCCSNNSSSSVVTAPHQLINPIHKRKNNFQFPHSKMNEKKQRKASSNNSSIDEGCIMRSDGGEEKTINKKKNKRGDDQKKKKKKDGEEIEKEAPTGYIHVRARRGQATDSHSLAERVRREKISERMKVLQALVPGCDEVTGKALMLDEIINYVQSLQNQVEFLSMKIASVNPMLYDFGMDWDAVMVKPERMGNLEAAQQPNVQEENQNKPDTTNIFNYTLDHSSLLQFQQTHMPNIMSHPQSKINGQLLWNRNEQSQKISSQSSGGEYVEGAYMKR